MDWKHQTLRSRETLDRPIQPPIQPMARLKKLSALRLLLTIQARFDRLMTSILLHHESKPHAIMRPLQLIDFMCLKIQAGKVLCASDTGGPSGLAKRTV
jgi:hypothetical protein